MADTGKSIVTRITEANPPASSPLCNKLPSDYRAAIQQAAFIAAGQPFAEARVLPMKSAPGRTKPSRQSLERQCHALRAEVRLQFCNVMTAIQDQQRLVNIPSLQTLDACLKNLAQEIAHTPIRRITAQDATVCWEYSWEGEQLKLHFDLVFRHLHMGRFYMEQPTHLELLLTYAPSQLK